MEYFDENLAVKELIDSGLLFVNYRRYYCDWEKILKPPTIVLYLSCSDTFGYACADAEDVSSEAELEKLYKYYKLNPVWGSTLFCIEKRRQKPIEPVIEKLKGLGLWKESYEIYE
jgi:hypothetical protein